MRLAVKKLPLRRPLGRADCRSSESASAHLMGLGLEHETHHCRAQPVFVMSQPRFSRIIDQDQDVLRQVPLTSSPACKRGISEGARSSAD
ncbi:hypothetical protein ACDY97_27365, partial [Rhizobium mongolense]|uniref:hypothetical protein n=1 Tax=Rhizobium mongolense TaxID=57676 RepID=UPI0035580593